MKIETAIKRIMENKQITSESKQSKLFVLALKTMPGSANQGKVIKAMESLKERK